MKKMFWQKTWFIVLMFFIVPPLGIALMWGCKKDWNKIIKIVLSAILALWTLIWGIMLFSPADESSESSNETSTVEESMTEPTTAKEETTAKPVVAVTQDETTTAQQKATTNSTTTKPSTTRKETTTAKPTTTKKETTTAKPTTTKAPTTVDPDSKVTVYRTKSGEKYHYENPCGNGTYYAVSLAEAKRAGLGPCEKCVLH